MGTLDTNPTRRGPSAKALRLSRGDRVVNDVGHLASASIAHEDVVGFSRLASDGLNFGVAGGSDESSLCLEKSRTVWSHMQLHVTL